jgi:hypothetical protein
LLRVWDARPWTEDAAVEREALGLLTFLFGRPLCRADVIAYLSNSPTITAGARQLALALVGRYREESEPERYEKAAWVIVQQPYLNVYQYHFALRQAETACRLAPNQCTYLVTLGAAQYRAGQYRQARASLAQADLLYWTTPVSLAFLAPLFPQGLVALWQAKPLSQAVPTKLAFLVMTHHQLGQEVLAQAAFARLREIAQNPEWPVSAEVQVLVREAEALLKTAPPTNKRHGS